jgi:hypothetical protein
VPLPPAILYSASYSVLALRCVTCCSKKAPSAGARLEIDPRSASASPCVEGGYKSIAPGLIADDTCGNACTCNVALHYLPGLSDISPELLCAGEVQTRAGATKKEAQSWGYYHFS